MYLCVFPALFEVCNFGGIHALATVTVATSDSYLHGEIHISCVVLLGVP